MSEPFFPPHIVELVKQCTHECDLVFADWLEERGCHRAAKNFRYETGVDLWRDIILAIIDKAPTFRPDDDFCYQMIEHVTATTNMRRSMIGTAIGFARSNATDGILRFSIGFGRRPTSVGFISTAFPSSRSELSMSVSDDATRDWVSDNPSPFQAAMLELDEFTRRSLVSSEPPPGTARNQLIETPSTIAFRFHEIMRRRLPHRLCVVTFERGEAD